MNREWLNGWRLVADRSHLIILIPQQQPFMLSCNQVHPCCTQGVLALLRECKQELPVVAFSIIILLLQSIFFMKNSIEPECKIIKIVSTDRVPASIDNN